MSEHHERPTGNIVTKAISALSIAISLLDPPEKVDGTQSEFGITHVTRAYDVVLDAASQLGNCNIDESFSNSGTLIKNADVIADVYRCLIVCCHLILAMATFDESIHLENNFNKGDSQLHLKESLHKSYNPPALSLAKNDFDTLVNTIQRCTYLLHILALLDRAKKIDAKNNYTQNDLLMDNWHDNDLPPSRYLFLQSFFEGPTPLISLSLDNSRADSMCHYHYFNTNSIDFDESNKSLPNENTTDDISTSSILLHMNDGLLEHEESFLLDIAFPNTASNPIDSKLSGGHFETNLEKTTIHNSEAFHHPIEEYHIPLIVHEGWLKYDPKNEKKCDGEDQKIRVRCKLYQHGALVFSRHPNIELQHSSSACTNETHLNSSKTWAYIIQSGSVCEPVISGNTFHFRVDQVQTISLPYPEFNKNHFEGQLCNKTPENLIFSIDQDSGGGLVDGFKWVTAIKATIHTISSQQDLQDQIENFWGQKERNHAVSSSVNFWSNYFFEKNVNFEEIDSEQVKVDFDDSDGVEPMIKTFESLKPT